MNASIYITAQDRYSAAVKAMTQNTKAFSKETEELERQLHQLTRNKYELKMDLKKEQQELRKLEKQFLETGDAADGLKMALQGQAVDHVRRNLDLVTASAKKAEKSLRGVGTETSKLQNRASGIVNALGSSGTAQTIGLVGGMGLQSAFGTEKASMISQVISSTASGALFGASLMGPIGAVAGATIGAGAGALMSYAERKESQQNALQDYIQTNLENTGAHFGTLAEGGIATAAGRETEMLAFSTLLKGKDNADTPDIDEGKEEGEAAARSLLDAITALGAETPFERQDLTGMARTLLSYGYQDRALVKDEAGNYLTGQAGMIETLKAVGDAGSALNHTAADMGWIVTYLGRLSSGGAATMADMNIFGDRGINALQWIADERFGGDYALARQAISGGKIDGGWAAEVILSRMQQEYAGSMRSLSETFSGLTSTLDDAEAELQNAYGEGYNETRKAGLQAEIGRRSDEKGTALAEAYSAIGAGEAALENRKNQLLDEAMLIVTGGMTLEESADFVESAYGGRLTKLKEKYTELKKLLTDTDEQNDEEAQIQLKFVVEEAMMIGENAFDTSEEARTMAQAQSEMIGQVAQDAALNDAYKDAGYMLGKAMQDGVIRAVGGSLSQNLVRGLAGAGYAEMEEYREAENIMRDEKPAAFGIRRVPFDDYPALLHEGERVLTASQARQMDRSVGLQLLEDEVSFPAVFYGATPAVSQAPVNGGGKTHEIKEAASNSGNVTVHVASLTVREDADVDKVARELYRRMELAREVSA